MLITCLEITDYKRVRKVAITPDADRSVILIGGKNGAGKSSTLDALTAAFGGARALAADPVRHGAGEAAIYVELDGGRLTIDRTIALDGKTQLEVRDAEGVVRAPQAVLDKLVGARFLDPLAFLQLAAKDQRAQLMKLIKDAERIDALNEKRERAFDRRRELGRDLGKAEGELARLPEVPVPSPIAVGTLTELLRAIAEQQRVGDGLHNQVTKLETLVLVERADADAGKQRVERLERELEQARAELPAKERVAADREAELAAARERLAAAAAAWLELAPRREQLDADLARATEHNRAVFAAEAQMTRRSEASAAVDKLKGDVAELAKALATIDQRKAAILAAAKLPVDGLTIDDDGLVLHGVPFAQASGAERLRVALALAIAASPGLNDVWIRDGALLDDDSLELVAKHAAAAGKRIWIERVGERDPGVIVIQDGQVRGA